MGSGSAALAYLAKHPRPAGVILDRHLPGESGLEILGKLRGDARFHAIPIVVLSGVLDPADELAISAQGGSCFVKPFSLGEWIQLAAEIQFACLSVARQAAAVA
ncbi:MAG: hypothetical protein JOZ62_19335 [Acidobacteriaceae bacterium]|nr:hypothetical protein [Acidobacteriaceae bacterium]